MSLNFLPKEIEDMLYDYKKQMEFADHYERNQFILNDIKKINYKTDGIVSIRGSVYFELYQTSGYNNFSDESLFILDYNILAPYTYPDNAICVLTKNKYIGDINIANQILNEYDYWHAFDFFDE